MSTRVLPVLVLFFGLLVSLSFCENFIKLPLQRREITSNFQSHDPELKQSSCLVDNPDAPKKTKKASITELCFYRNLFYNVQVSLGSTPKRKYELALGLLSPYTWVKSDNCSNCYYDSDDKLTCKKNCNMLDFTRTHKCLQKKKCQKTNITASLDYINHNFTGHLVYEGLKFEASESRIKRFKLIDVDNITNAPNFKSDGVLGLAIEDIDENETDAAEGDAGIMTAIMNAAEDVEDRIFSIYIRENDPDDEDYQPAIIFGDFNPEYQDDVNDQIKWVKINNNSKFDWDLPISSMNIKSTSKENLEVILEKNSAILTLDTTFIGLPTKALNKIVGYLSSLGMECSVESDKFDSLFCAKVKKSNIDALSLSFVFQDTSSSPKSIKIDPKILVKECSGDLGDKAVACYFLIHQSHSRSTILGEAFLKNYYAIFDMETQKVGLVQAASKEDEPISHIVRREGRKFSRFLKYFFIFLGIILAILCPFYIYQLCKIYRRKKDIRYEESNSSKIDQIGDETAYDFQNDVKNIKEKLDARKKAEEQNKKEGIKEGNASSEV